MISKSYDFLVSSSCVGERLDVWLSKESRIFSRSQITRRIESGEVSINGSIVKRPSRRMMSGEKVRFTPQSVPAPSYEPENIPLDVFYEDDYLLVVNKPSFMVVHPAKGHESGTLVNALLYHCGKNFRDEFFTVPGEASQARIELEQVFNEDDDDEVSMQAIGFSDTKNVLSESEMDVQKRLGIVHRLDQGTSGLLVCAKNIQVLNFLQKQFQQRTILRAYFALVFGVTPVEGEMNTPYGRHLTESKKFTSKRGNKRAITHYKTEERYPGGSLLRVQLKTGRTHQIRVHLSEAMFPLVGDTLYTPSRVVQKSTKLLQQLHKTLGHQALHAAELGFIHPITNQMMHFKSPLPEDFTLARKKLINFVDENPIKS